MAAAEAVDLLADQQPEAVDLLAGAPAANDVRASQADVRRAEPRELARKAPAYYPHSFQQEQDQAQGGRRAAGIRTRDLMETVPTVATTTPYPAQPSQADVRRSDLAATAATPSDEEIAAASSPAKLASVSRGGKMQVEGAAPATMPPAERETAAWFGEGGVATQLPAALVTGSKMAIAGLNTAMREQMVSVLSKNVKTGQDPFGFDLGEQGLARERAALEEATKAGEAAKLWARQVQREAALTAPKGEMTIFQQAVWSFVQSAPPTALGLSVGILTRNPALAMTIAGAGGSAMQAGQTYLEATGKGASHTRAMGVALADGIIEGLDAAPLGQALKPGSPFLTRIAKTMAAEGATEGVQQVTQDLNAYLNWNPDITLGEAWKNLKIAVIAGAMGGAVYGTAGAAAQPSEKQQANAALRQVAKDIEAVDTSVGADQVAVDLLRPENAQVTVEKSTPVEISTPTAAQQQPFDDVSVSELQNARVDRTLRQKNEARKAADNQALADEMRPQDAVGTVREVSPPAQAASSAPRAAAEVAEAPPAAEAQQRPARPPARPSFMQADPGRDTLTTAIAKLGGLSLDQAPDITGEEAPARAPNSPMHFVIRRNGGDSLDGVAEKLVELGYFPNRDDLNVIREAIADELAGRGTHHSMWAADDRSKERIQAENDTEREAIAFAEQAGIPELEKVSEPQDLAVHHQFVPASEAEMTGTRLALAELTQKAVEVDEAAVERLAIQSEGLSDEDYAVGLQEIINGDKQNVAARDAGVGQAVEPFALTQETEVERQARETAGRDRADRERRELEQRESRARADRERGDFTLTGSERGADINPKQGNLYSVDRGQEGNRGSARAIAEPEDVLATLAGGRPREGWVSATRISRAGRPRVVYRGAEGALAAQSFGRERLGFASGNPSSGLGVWFTPSESEAGTYGPVVSPVYLDIRNPKVYRVEDLPGFDSVAEAFALREELRAQGHDGIIVTAKHLGGKTHVVAFDAAQVIPATADQFASGWEIAGGPTEESQRTWADITKAVGDLATQLTPTANVRTVLSIWGNPHATGRYNAPRNLIDVALTAPYPERTFRHEAVHALRAMGLFTPQEWRALEAQASKTWRTEFVIDRRYADQKLDRNGLNEEAIAEAFASYKAGTLNAAPPIQKIMRKIADFFTRLGNLLRGMGFQTVEDIFAKIESGEVGRRPGAIVGESNDGIKYAAGPTPPNQATPPTKQTYVASGRRQLRRAMMNPPANTWEADAGLVKRMLVTPRTIAAFDGDFVPVYQTAVEQWKFRDQLIAKFERESEPYFKASKEDQAVVGKILEHDRLTGQVALAGKNMTVHFTSPVAELSKPGERVTVTDAQKTAYWSVRSMLNMALDEFRDQTLQDFGLAPGMTAAQVAQQAAAATSKSDAARLLNIAGILQGIEDARRTGYVPFSRYGEIGITVRNPLTKALLHYETIEPGILQRRGGKQLAEMPEVKERLAALRAKYPGMTIADPFQVPRGGLPQQVKLEEVDALAEMAKIDNQTWDSVRTKLQEAQAGQGFRSHFFRSKNVPGYSTDFERGLANYVNGISGYLARRRYAPKWIAAVSPIPLNKPKLRQYAQDYQKYVNSPAEEFGFLRSVNFVYYLTSLATWITNLTQVPFVSMPWTAQFANPVAITAAYTRASAETAAMLTVKKGMQLFSAQKAPADVRAAVQDAYDQGLFIPITTYESMGIARNQGRRLRNLSKGSQTAVELFGLGFTMAERQNRIATFIALYRLARDRPEVRQNFDRVMAGNALGRELAARWTPQAFAEFGIDETHFKSGKVNRPAVARNAGTVVFQFKMFMWNMIERLVTMTALQGTEGRAAAALMLFVLGMVSGLWGLPGAENLRDLYEALMKRFRNLDVNADAQVRKIIVELTGSATLAQAVSGGATRALPEPWNIDLSKRVGMGKILPSEPGEVAGVSYDLWWKRPMQAMEQFEVDNYLLGLAELMPKQAADFMTQLSWAQSGVRTKASDQPLIPPEKVTPGMRIEKTIGFTPGSVANIREAERAEQVAKSAANEARNDFYRRMAKAVAEEERTQASGDLLAHAEAKKREEAIWKDIDAWNKDHPEDYLQVRLDRKTARTNLAKEFYGADYDKGARKQSRGEIGRLRQIYGRDTP